MKLWSDAPAMCPVWACPKTAQTVLGWSARRSLEEMCRDGWAWQQANPGGYRDNS